jgi:hypothetical protein
LFPTGYQKQLLAFGTEPTPEELQAAGTNVTREQYIGENLYHKFTTMQTNIRNKLNLHWKPLKRSGIPPEESQRLDFDEVLKRHWDNNQQLLHQQRVRNGPKKASYKKLINAEDQKVELDRIKTASALTIKPYPGWGNHLPSEFIVFKMLGLPTGSQCLKCLETPVKGSGPIINVDDLSE